MTTQAFKQLGAAVKSVGALDDAASDAPYGWVEGIANAFEVDRQGDLILPEALAGSFDKYMLNPVVTFGHGMDGNPVNGTLPAGSTLKLWQDGAGNTLFRMRFAAHEDAQKVRKMYIDKDMRAFSVHFIPFGPSIETRNPTPEERKRYTGVERVITKLEMIEIACAVVPVNAGSLMLGAKSLNGFGLTAVPTLTPRGAKAMKSILTSDHRKLIDGAAKAYEGHVKSMEGIKASLEDLSASKEGSEADHGAMAAKCMKAVADAGTSHAALGEAVKSLSTALPAGDEQAEQTDKKDELAEEAPAPAAGSDGQAGNEDGSAPVDDQEMKQFTEAYQKAMK